MISNKMPLVVRWNTSQCIRRCGNVQKMVILMPAKRSEENSKASDSKLMKEGITRSHKISDGRIVQCRCASCITFGIGPDLQDLQMVDLIHFVRTLATIIHFLHLNFYSFG